jgi:CheY-like chemotaxis protein
MKDSQDTILIVEDEDHDVDFLRRAFARAGVANPVQHVQNGEEAVDYLRGVGKYADRKTYPFPRVMLTDLKMPQMGGIELLQWIQSNPEYRVVPTIVLTSSTHEADVRAAFAAGVSGYMVKPVDFSQLERLAGVIASYWKQSLTPPPPG